VKGRLSQLCVLSLIIIASLVMTACTPATPTEEVDTPETTEPEEASEELLFVAINKSADQQYFIDLQNSFVEASESFGAEARKFYLLPDMEASWVGMLRETDQCWMTISWDSEDVPYFGLWVDEGYFNPEPVIAPEPSTGFYDSLAFAANQGRHMTIEPGDTASWSLVLQFGNQKDQFPYPCKPRQSRH
jgi:hypothetical protein